RGRASGHRAPLRSADPRAARRGLAALAGARSAAHGGGRARATGAARAPPGLSRLREPRRVPPPVRLASAFPEAARARHPARGRGIRRRASLDELPLRRLATSGGAGAPAEFPGLKTAAAMREAWSTPLLWPSRQR